MDVLCSTSGIVSSKFPGQGLKDIAQAGFSGIPLVPIGHAYAEEAVEDWKTWAKRQRKAKKKSFYGAGFGNPVGETRGKRGFARACREAGGGMYSRGGVFRKPLFAGAALGRRDRGRGCSGGQSGLLFASCHVREAE